jgi:uncharacterized protein (TIGR02271 family)
MTDIAYDWLQGSTLYDVRGEKIGKVDVIYDDTTTGQPEWALVHTGLLGTKNSFVPIGGATRSGDQIRVPYEKGQVKSAPAIDADADLSVAEEQELYRHYGIAWEARAHDSGSGRFGGEIGEAGGPGHDVSGPNTDSAMTRSEEELRVGTRSQEAGRVRLRKHVVTENVTQTVPVQREELRIEREPITEANVGAANDGPAISEEEHEIVLHEEEPVVEKRTVPKERVRLDTETVTGEQTVDEDVRKERIDVDESGPGRL